MQDTVEAAGTPPPVASTTWTTTATHLLITERLQLEAELKKPQYKGKLWSRIAVTLKDKGHTYSSSECDSKWRNLMGTYRMNLDKRSKSGSGCEHSSYHVSFDLPCHISISILLSPQQRNVTVNIRPIELVWVKLKSEVRKRNKTPSLSASVCQHLREYASDIDEL
ncbi:hypothetical protein ANN_20607 [Periplaneta americana]|uniref:Myb/SANT-like DNA-binding domain-containing protein n=1 Tax=Periplaneta americana TaxID=6978 RepID=A0ABQ8SD92_PERAM|nr:hypothetical protein ANN_20607 [Periplaneta americana]